MVNVDLVVVYHTELVDRGSVTLKSRLPVELNRERLGSLFLNLYDERVVLERSGSYGEVVGDVELANEHLVAFGSRVDAETDVLDYITLGDTGYIEALCFPGCACEFAGGNFNPVVGTLFLEDNGEVGSTCGTLECCAVEHDVVAGSCSA